MVVRWIEGFETRQCSDFLNRIYTATGATITAGATGRLHGTCMRADNLNLISPELVSPDEETWIVQVAIRKSSKNAVGASQPGIRIRNASGIQLEMRVVAAATPDDNDWFLQILRGATVLASSRVFSWGTGRTNWWVFQLKARIHTASGTYEVRGWDYNDTSPQTIIAAATGVNTANQAVNGADSVGIALGTSGATEMEMDDIVVMDGSGSAYNDFTSMPFTVIGQRPSGDVAGELDFTPSTGTDHYVLVDDAPTSGVETGEVTSSVVGDVDLYDFAQTQLDLIPTGSPPAVAAVQVDVEAAMKNSGSKTLVVRVKDGSNQADDSKSLVVSSLTKASFFTILAENPTGTPAPWTIATLKTVQIGVKTTA